MQKKVINLKNHHPKGKQYVIPDLHGYSITFETLLHKIGFTKDDELFLLGDYINRGPNSKGVIDVILKLIDEGYTVFPLKGNHEDMALKSQISPTYGMSDITGKILHEPYHTFFHQLIYAVEMETRFLSHAGFNFTVEKPFEEYRGMLWTNKIRLGYTSTTDKQLIRGHLSYSLDVIKEAIDQNQQVITLDNGLYKTKEGFGQLCCLELTEWKLYVQENLG